MSIVNDLLTRVGGLLDKEFLFAAYVPVIILLMFNGVVIGYVIGFAGVFAWIESLSLGTKTGVGAVMGVFTIVFAYVLSALRPAMLSIWSGGSDAALGRMLKPLRQQQKQRVSELNAKAEQAQSWIRPADAFTARILEISKETSTGNAIRRIADDDLNGLEEQVRNMEHAESVDDLKKVLDAVHDAYRDNKDEPRVIKVVQQARNTLAAITQPKRRDEKVARRDLFRKYDGRGHVRATRLGNIVEAYNAYPWHCYQVEPSMLWPRLQEVISDGFMEKITQARMFLDFFLTVATLYVINALLTMLLGPWLWTTPGFWLSLGLVQLAIAYLFYAVAVQAALGFGDLMRASCDLFRLDLLKKLSLPFPKSHTNERKQWNLASQLATYGLAQSELVYADYNNAPEATKSAPAVNES